MKRFRCLLVMTFLFIGADSEFFSRFIIIMQHAGTVLCAICFRCHGDGSLNTDVSCTKGSMIEHIVHIDGGHRFESCCDHQRAEPKGSARFV